VAVSGSGQILTWGANQNGLLGLGSSAQQNVPTPTPVPDVFAAHVRSSPQFIVRHMLYGVPASGHRLCWWKCVHVCINLNAAGSNTTW
jgi:Regulator of chromosome condensation (RCC1) repeat